MPQLKQLDEFRSSFLHVANEAQILSKSDVPPDKLELPVNVPPTPFPEGLEGTDIPPEPGELNIDELDLDLDGGDYPDVTFDTSDTPAIDDSDLGGDVGESAELADIGGADLDANLNLGGADLDGFDPDSITGMDSSLGNALNDPFANMNLGGDVGESADLGAGLDLGGIGDSANLDLGGDAGFNLDDLGLSDTPNSPTDDTLTAGFDDLDGISGLNEPAPTEPADTSGPAPTGSDSGDTSFEMPDLEEGIDLSESLDLGGEAPGSGFGVPLEDISGSDFGSGPKESSPFPIGDLSPADFSSSSDDSFDISGFESASDLGESLDLGTESSDGTLAGTPDTGSMETDESSGLGSLDIGSFDTSAFDTGAPDFGSSDSGSFDSAAFDTGADFDAGAAFDAGTAFDAGASDADSMDTGDSGLGSLDIGSFDTSAFDTGAPDTGADFDAGSLDAGSMDTGVSDLSDMDINPFGTDDSSGSDSFDNVADSAISDTSPSLPEPVLDTPDFSATPDFNMDDGMNDFALAGIDDISDTDSLIAKSTKSKIPAASSFAAKDDVEEINLSDAEYKQLLETLSVYPLNLRMACEEIIAEHAVAPEQMSALIKLLVRGAPARETAILAGKILGRTITIPKGYTKQTGSEMEAEQSSFAYIFVHRFLPVLRIFAGVAIVALSLAYLCWHFIVVPIQANNLYKEGYAQLHSGEYTRSNELFRLAFEKKRVKKWFYRYAEGFRDERQYIFAERKYDELLHVYPRDKKGALDYAAMETYYLRNYEKADKIIRNNILDYSVNDKEGLVALAENNLAWGESDPSRYEEARAAYSRLIEIYGRKDPYLEGMLKYFIRTDKLNEVLPLQAYFMGKKKRKITVPTLAELGAYLLDKRFEEKEGVPEEYAEKIEGIRDILLRAISEDASYPESYYHLARYYRHYRATGEERQTLKDAINAFNAAREETPKRAAIRVDAHRRLAEVLILGKEYFPAEETIIKGIKLYEDARARQVLKTDAMFGRLYAVMGDLEYFVKDGNMEAALRFYEEAELNLWSPPEIQYRMGAAHYQLNQWDEALRRFFIINPSMPNNRRLLYALGNVSFLRGNYFAAQGYYNRLMDILDMEHVRFPNLTPDSRSEEKELTERIMVLENNLGVTLEALTRVSGDTSYRSRALGLFANSIRAWDVLTRDPATMNRMRPFKDLYGPGVNLAYLNVRAITLSEPNYDPQIFMRIDRDCVEPSDWEDFTTRDYQLSDQLLPVNGN